MPSLPGSAASYWIESSPRTDYPPLADTSEVEVAVIGAGIAGVHTAWELARRGKSVALLEAGRVVGATTGFTTAKVSALHSLRYATLRSEKGPGAAHLYASSQQGAIDLIEDTATELGIDCDFERVPAFVYAVTPDEVRAVNAEVDAARKAGLDASLVTRSGLPFPIAAAIRVEDQAQFHPRKFLLGLLEDFTAHGGQIFEHTRVTGLDEGEPCVLTTDQGFDLRADDVVVTTQYPVFDHLNLFTRLLLHREVVIAATIPAADDPGGTYLTREESTRSVRTAPHGPDTRLLIVTGEGFSPGEGDTAERYETLAAWTMDHFPRAEIRYRWAAQDVGTPDEVPYIGRLHPGAEHAWVATGFGGWGMTNGAVSGRLLADLIMGSESEFAALYDPGRLEVTSEALPIARQGMHVAKHFVGDRFRASRVDSVDEIPVGSGAVARIDGELCAVYRDPAGTDHVVSAICTHLGCVVAFDNADPAWECPCHGSRFAVDGTVLVGPAKRPLSRRAPG